MSDDDLHKHRLIYFSDMHADADQAAKAMLLLSDVDGVLHLNHISSLCLSIEYNIRSLNLRVIEEALCNVGFHLDNHLIHKLTRALYYYCEETQQANLGYTQNCKDFTKRIFMNEYSHHDHGCRDERPEHWREYL